MFDKLLNLNIETCSKAELKIWVRQVIPIVIKFIKAGTRYTQIDNNTFEVIPCHTCPKKSNCNGEPCETLEAFLPSKDKGKGYKENTIGISLEKFSDINIKQPGSYKKGKSTSNRDILKTIKKTRLTDVYEDYKKCWYLLTDKQQEVIILRYGEGMTQKQIAEKTGKKHSAVSDLLKRARNRKDKHEKKLRAEKFELLTKKEAE